MKDSENRKMHSSLFNCAPLSTNCHAFGPLHDTDIESFLLRKAAEKIFFAAGRGLYLITEYDLAFLEFYQ